MRRYQLTAHSNSRYDQRSRTSSRFAVLGPCKLVSALNEQCLALEAVSVPNDLRWISFLTVAQPQSPFERENSTSGRRWNLLLSSQDGSWIYACASYAGMQCVGILSGRERFSSSYSCCLEDKKSFQASHAGIVFLIAASACVFNLFFENSLASSIDTSSAFAAC